MEVTVAEDEPEGPIVGGKLLFSFVLWTLLAGYVGVFVIWQGPELPQSGNCIGPYGNTTPCALNGDLANSTRSLLFGFMWLLTAVILVVCIVFDRRRLKPSERRERSQRRRDEDDRMMSS